VPNSNISLHGLQGLFIEYLVNQAKVFEDDGLLAVTHGDAGGFLPTVLEGKEAIEW